MKIRFIKTINFIKYAQYLNSPIQRTGQRLPFYLPHCSQSARPNSSKVFSACSFLIRAWHALQVYVLETDSGGGLNAGIITGSPIPLLAYSCVKYG